MAEEENKKKRRKKKEEPAAPKQEEIHYDSNLWSIIMFALGILCLLLTFIDGTAGWHTLHRAIRGAFGVSVFLVSPILIYAASMIAKDKKKEAIFTKVVQGVLVAVLLSSVMQVVFVGDIRGDDLSEKISNLYNDGVRLRSGGVISAIAGIPLVSVFGIRGARIIIVLLLFVLIMLLSNVTLLRLFEWMKKPFKNIRETVSAFREEADSRRYLEEVKETSRYEIEEQEENYIKLETKKKKAVPDPNPVSEPASVKKKALKAAVSDKDDVKENNSEESDTEIRLPDFSDIRNFFRKKHKKETDDLEKILNEKEESLTLESTTSNTIDIPIITPDVVEKLAAMNNEAAPPSVSEDIKNEAHKPSVNLSKKTDGINIPTDKTYRFPSIDFLKAGTSSSDSNAEAEMQDTAIKLVQTLENFGVKTTLSDIHRGPTVTRYELQPSPGVKISRITGLADDIALNLAAAGVRIEAPIPGKAAVGIEVPNLRKDTVSLREMLESEEFRSSKSRLSFAVGRDIAGKILIGDIAKMPHVIIAGSTGSGKSVCTNSIIMSILYKATPDQVKLLLIDPKIVEFKVYDGIPHLLIPVVTDPRKAAGALNWAVQEMLRRYKLFADNNVRDLASFNEMAAETEGVEPMPQIVIAIDELADLMMAASNEVEDAICRLAQMARAAGMHLIIATQRPTVDIITGLIKANIPSRIALSVMSQTDSRTILDTGGAEKLLGQGDMLYFPSGIPKPIRLQGCFCSTKEIETVVNYIKNNASADYSDEILDEIEKNIPVPKGDKSGLKLDASSDGDDELIEKAIDIIIDLGQASTSSLQRKLKLGYARAARIMDELEEMGVIGPSEGAKPRKILMSKAQWTERKMSRFSDGESEEE